MSLTPLPRRARSSRLAVFGLALVTACGSSTDLGPTRTLEADPGGAALTDPSSPARLLVPAGAVLTRTQLRVEPADPARMARPVTDAADLRVVAAARFLPDGQRFQRPVLALVDLPRLSEPGRPLVPVVFDEATGAWRRATDADGRPLTAMVSPDGRQALWPLTHFSDNGVALSELHTIDLTLEGRAYGVHHHCHRRDFGVWLGAPVGGFLGLGAAYARDGWRRGVFADTFEGLLIGAAEEGVPVEAMSESATRTILALGATRDVATVSDTLLRLSRDGWGVLRAGRPGFDPTTWSRTTLRNVRTRVEGLFAPLTALELAVQIDEASTRVLVLWALSAGVQQSRIETLERQLAETGLDRDPAVREGMAEARARVEARHMAFVQSTASALQALAREQDAATAEALFEHGWQVWLPGRIIQTLVNSGRLTARAGARLAAGAGLAIDLVVGSNEEVRRKAGLCALATMYEYARQIAPPSEHELDRFELMYATYAMFAAGRVRFLNNEGIDSAYALLNAGLNALPFARERNDAARAYWEGEQRYARERLEAITGQRVAAAGGEDPPVAAPAAPPSVPVRVDAGGVSQLAWPFDTAAWHNVAGSPYHRCSDEHAQDLNTNLGTGDAEIDLGPMYLRSPITGTVRFADFSTYDPGRGWQLLIESDTVPGFFVSMAHNQRFDPAGWVGRHVAAGERLAIAVGDSGGDPSRRDHPGRTTLSAHSHLVAWRNVLGGEELTRVLRGQSPEGYACRTSRFAAPFELVLPPPVQTLPRCPSGEGVYCGAPLGLDARTRYRCLGGALRVEEACATACDPRSAGEDDRCLGEPAPVTSPPPASDAGTPPARDAIVPPTPPCRRGPATPARSGCGPAPFVRRGLTAPHSRCGHPPSVRRGFTAPHPRCGHAAHGRGVSGPRRRVTDRPVRFEPRLRGVYSSVHLRLVPRPGAVRLRFERGSRQRHLLGVELGLGVGHVYADAAPGAVVPFPARGLLRRGAAARPEYPLPLRQRGLHASALLRRRVPTAPRSHARRVHPGSLPRRVQRRLLRKRTAWTRPEHPLPVQLRRLVGDRGLRARLRASGSRRSRLLPAPLTGCRTGDPTAPARRRRRRDPRPRTRRSAPARSIPGQRPWAPG